MRSLAGSPAPERRIVFEYDHRGRRVRQTVWNDRDNGQGSELSDLIALYDGWNLVTELNANSGNTRVRTYTWGLDLSGSSQGAGGVGGLLALTYYGSATTNCFVAFDGNGNVAALVNALDSSPVAQYEYGPFGEVIRVTGTMGLMNPFRFSTKHQDGETDLLYYGYRFYSAGVGRWINRDPAQEIGGYSLYLLLGNDVVNMYDFLGLWGASVHYYATRSWAHMVAKYPIAAATAVAEADEGVDGGFIGWGKGWAPLLGDQSYHFNRNHAGVADSRLFHFAHHIRAAEAFCAPTLDLPESAAEQLGVALHSYQDWVAHGDYAIENEGEVWTRHNSGSPQRAFGAPYHYPDNPSLDAVGGWSGRPAGTAMRREGGREYAIYERGIKRYALTYEITTKALRGFKDFVRDSGGCRCRRYFGLQD
jgi:RHS repeat-associated protein